MSGGTSWRSKDASSEYLSHDYADFAQEFLRRNVEYAEDYDATQRRISERPTDAQSEQEGLARRWGLSFPLSS
ncbi:MAG: hypothetical protein IBJ12_03165 [Sphingomonadaceae bacterium]|nr:hypothetical protein [Sphingomonadaceae bacterium]